MDQRADLYALGATLYELATGEPPFGAGDPLRLTHDHLARVPTPPGEINAAVPEMLSAVIMHLLEKEPDDRYQSADGLLYDLKRMREPGVSTVPPVGECDFPLRLLPPSRLVGRDDEVVALAAAFDEALTDGCRGVLVGGAPGVGKTALVDQLRPVVTGNDGWFVAGKFDQYRRDLESGGIFQAFRALGRLLLAEPEDELVELRERMLAALGANAGMAAAAMPEFAALLGVAPEAGDPLTAQVRMQHSAVATLRAVASRKRPVVVFVDDLQWAGPTAVGFIDLVFREQVEGLLLVGAYRDEVDPTHPLAASLSRWRQQPGVTHVDLVNLARPSVAALVAEVLRVDRTAASVLAELIEPLTRGNPYETVELLNTLRQEAILTPSSTGWRWDEPAVRSLLARSEVAELPMSRLAALSASSREVLEVMACLGGRAELSVLAAGTAELADVVEQRLAPALEEGVLVAEAGAHDALQFRHDRIREAILDGLGPKRRHSQRLTLARRLAATPELFAVAAEQYLPVIDAVTDAGERSHVVALLRRAAQQATPVGDYSQVHTLLTVASQECKSGLTWAPLTCVHILCDGGGIRWCQGGFCSACRVWLRQLGRWVVQRSAQVGQQPQSGRGHGEPAPSGRGAIEHCPHQRQAGVLAWQPADDLHPPARFPEGAFDEVGVPDAVAVLARESQVDGQRLAVSEQGSHRRRVRVAPALGERVDVLLGELRRVETRFDVVAQVEDRPVVGLHLGLAVFGHLGQDVSGAMDKTALPQRGAQGGLNRADQPRCPVADHQQRAAQPTLGEPGQKPRPRVARLRRGGL